MRIKKKHLLASVTKEEVVEFVVAQFFFNFVLVFCFLDSVLLQWRRAQRNGFVVVCSDQSARTVTNIYADDKIIKQEKKSSQIFTFAHLHKQTKTTLLLAMGYGTTLIHYG